jgi:outer membrane protein TolC
MQALRGSWRLGAVSILLATTLVSSVRAEQAPTDAPLPSPVDRASVERLAVVRSPALKAMVHRIRAIDAQGQSEGSLPAPEFMAQIWQVPFAHPLSLDDAGMIMVGLAQTFPAPGSLGPKEDARHHEARAEAAMLAQATLDVVRQVDHAFVDYRSAVARRHVQEDRRRILAKWVDAARARYAAGGSLAEVARAEAELARVEVDVAGEQAAEETAKIRLNTLLLREPNAPVGEPADEPVETIVPSPRDVAARAEQARHDVRAASERSEALALQARSAEREATVPSFSIAALYFAPVGPMPVHGFGTNVLVSLPWLWGSRSSNAGAQREMAAAGRDDGDEARLRARSDAVAGAALAGEQERRYAILVEGALPASRRALDVTEAAYGSGKADLASLLGAERAIVEVQMDVASTRAALDHALVDVDWAAAGRVPRRPIGGRRAE